MFFYSPLPSRQSSSSSDSNSDSETELISIKKSKSKSKSKSTTVNIPIEQPIRIENDSIKSKDLIKNEIDAIVNSCFTSTNKEVKRKIKLGKRTAADDQEYEHEDEYLSNLINHQNGRINRFFIYSFIYIIYLKLFI